MKIRKFRKEDSKELTKLIKEFVGYTRKTYTKNALFFDDFLNYKNNTLSRHILEYLIKLKNSLFLIAHDDSKIIGYIVGTIVNKPHRVMNKAGHLESFFVSKDYRNKGIGKKLNKALVEWFKKNNCDHIELDVFYGNNKSIYIYKKWGFKEIQVKMKKKI